MPTDYKTRGPGHEKRPLPGFVWLLAGLSIGLFVALLVYLDKQPEVPANFGAAIQKELDKIKQHTNTATEKNNDKSAKPAEPKFNFYTILPELEVLIPDSETQPPKSRPTGNVPESNKQYVLQAGSFKNKSDAEKLKASLALLGFEAHIQNVTVNNTAWHRVRIGPYGQSKELYEKIDQLRENNIDAVPMALKSDN
ncbi:MAG: SPOR domain-containing protein [Gammaproteobacteria bacterium]|nr:SPOR domain-containing protein [Gammaproteobacteria bacterium]